MNNQHPKNVNKEEMNQQVSQKSLQIKDLN